MIRSTFGLLVLSVVVLAACTRISDDESSQRASSGETNQVLVLGMIHGRHLQSSLYSVDVLSNLITEINPDYVLTEIPPDRFDQAVKEFKESGHITESRVSVFPEYVDVLFPLTLELDFEIIPTAGWTAEMAQARTLLLRQIREDPNRADDWKQYQEAIAASDQASLSGGLPDDPYYIHSQAYDDAQEIELSVYNDLFNEELGLGGWDNINEAHYAHIENALNEHSGEGVRILITYGAGHKGWFLRQLRRRSDIELLEAKPFLDAISK